MSKEIVQDVLGPAATKDLWSTVYPPALPVTPQAFALGSVLPAVLYMMRWGQRRGQGKFARIHGGVEGAAGRPIATIARVAAKLAADSMHFGGFEGDVERAILGDLLLAFCLENKKHSTGRDEQVQRAFPTHYFSSWIDLPANVAHLRGVPELIVAILARGGHFPVAAGFDNNLLLSLFGAGTSIGAQPDNVRSDTFDEAAAVGLDQLLTIRLAQSLGEAPSKIRGALPAIPSQLPLATRAADVAYEDFNLFLRAYSRVIPRQSLLPMLESCLAIGLTNMYLSTVSMLLKWSNSGEAVPKGTQEPWPLFVDCSVSTDADLRRVSEDCVDDLLRRLGRLPVWLMCLRILDRWARYGPLRNVLPEAEPDPAARVAFLGSLLRERDGQEARDIERDLDRKCAELAEKLAADLEAQEPNAEAVLLARGQHPAWRLAEALVVIIGDKQQFGEFRKHLDSCLMANEANGLARRRRTTVRGKLTDRRSIVLSNTALDYLAHRHQHKANRSAGLTTLSLTGFLAVLRERYGLFVDEAPGGMAIPVDLLRRNREFFERRLRDMGLLVGVNDAESMKRLRPRFEAERG